MSWLFRSVRVVDPASPANERTVDLRVDEAGRIAAIGEGLAEDGAAVIAAEGLHAGPGWFDSFAHFRDPGQEHKEDLASGAAAAAHGGFTAVAVTPDTDPPLHAKAEVAYVRRRSAELPVHVHPYGALSRDGKGRELTEMHDLRAAGAIAFGEGHHPVHHPGLLLRALRYTQPFDGLVVNLPLDRDMAGKAVVHEGLAATRLGMAGMPGLAESLMVERDLAILAYTGGRLHFPVLSAARSVALLRAARAEGLNVSAGVAAYQLLLDDTALEGYDTNVKVLPPLRGAADREALIDGVLDGTITVVCSHHAPQHEDDKKVEFEYAGYGMASIETTYAALRTALGSRLSPALTVDLLGRSPRERFGLPQPRVEVGAEAELTLFQPDAPWTPSPGRRRSRSANNPLYGRTLTGRVYGVFAKGRWWPAEHAAADLG